MNTQLLNYLYTFGYLHYFRFPRLLVIWKDHCYANPLSLPLCFLRVDFRSEITMSNGIQITYAICMY